MLKRCNYDYNRTALTCHSCHGTIHKFFTNKELAEQYYTEEMLLSNEKFVKYVLFKRKHNGTHVENS